MNATGNKPLLGGDKFIPEIHLHLHCQDLLIVLVDNSLNI